MTRRPALGRGYLILPLGYFGPMSPVRGTPCDGALDGKLPESNKLASLYCTFASVVGPFQAKNAPSLDQVMERIGELMATYPIGISDK
ncbi:hypothetical protein HYU14_06655 [Candidatus Woesearchaeota archaeon]|nr:hypothetical protein [Candidatus Woesearchaeota archaeon]